MTLRGSYPTYEEWKLSFIFYPLYAILSGSYPTYEEWKLPFFQNYLSINIRSYPTYEEWKRYNC